LPKTLRYLRLGLWPRCTTRSGPKVHSSGRAFEQFKEAINDEDFEDLLKDAQADPKGVAAQDLLKKVLPFLNISSRQFF